MVLSFFCLLFIVIIYPVHVLGLEDCPGLSCGTSGTAIRFPFRLKGGHPKSCGYPGFDLSCTEKNQTLLELPNSVTLFVKTIDYQYQLIEASHPDGCFAKELRSLNLSTSPFRFRFRFLGHHMTNYTLFNCSSMKRIQISNHIPCLDARGYQVFSIYSDDDISGYSLSSCTKLFSGLAPNDLLFSDMLYLKWSEPMCGHCEQKGKHCRLKNGNRSVAQIECFDVSKGKKGTIRKLVTAGIILGSILAVMAIIAVYYLYRSNKMKKENDAKIEKFLENYRTLKPSRYTYADIKRITNEFKEKLGEGAYGTVFKGTLSSEIHVAVKILNSSIGDGEEFINEVGTMGRIHHVNVVRLVGFCADGFRRALVYEFLPNESLEKFIFSNDGKKHSLGWEKLQDIAIAIAKGIEYLHQGCEQRILHFDIKPHNILLDENFNPKISDFGLAKLCSKDQSIVSMTAARGTMGYIAPEVYSRNFGNVSYKSDVYSFGMLLLEMVGGRKNIDVAVENASQVYFPEWAYKRLNQGDELVIRIEEDGDANTAKKLTIVGLWCIQWYPVGRPSMKNVVQMLEGEGDNLSMPPNPFGSTDTMRMNPSVPVRNLHLELAVITETE